MPSTKQLGRQTIINPYTIRQVINACWIVFLLKEILMQTISQILESKGYDRAEQSEIVESGYGYNESLDQVVRAEFNMNEPIYLEEGYCIGEADGGTMNEIAVGKGYKSYEDLLAAMDKRLKQLAEDFPVKSVMDHRRRIGKKIRSLREEEGLTLDELAEKTGLLKQNISRIELGKYSTGLDILSKIAAALGKHVDIV